MSSKYPNSVIGFQTPTCGNNKIQKNRKELKSWECNSNHSRLHRFVSRVDNPNWVDANYVCFLHYNKHIFKFKSKLSTLV